MNYSCEDIFLETHFWKAKKMYIFKGKGYNGYLEGRKEVWECT